MFEESIFKAAAWHGRRLENELIIDAHIHVGPYFNFYMPAPTADDLLVLADRLGVRMMIASGMAVNVDVVLANEQTISAHRKYPDRFLPYINVSATYPEEIGAILDMAEKEKFCHFKFHRMGPALPYDHHEYNRVYEYANSKQGCILLHTWGKNDLEAISKAAKKFRNVNFLLAHAGLVDPEAYVEIAKKNQNTFLELAGSPIKYNLVEYFVKMVGAERVIYGSDAPFINMNQQIGQVLFSRISDEDKRLILGLNAQRLFGESIVAEVTNKG
ncbi:amidohydrolase family protein [candidate division KSB1 bacterium]|nr:amidohydrolase family protein [candidate division KSB1 bacterium]